MVDLDKDSVDGTGLPTIAATEPKTSAVPKSAARKPSPKKKKPSKTKKNGKKSVGEATRTRRSSLFPASSFEEALTIPLAIQKYAGQKIRRLTLFDQIGKSPDSGTSRQWITNASKYGLVTGSYVAEYLELTPDGFKATSSEVPPRERLTARFKLAIEQIEPFKQLYDVQKGSRLPATSVLEDLARENGIPSEDARECVETFIVNAKFLGVLRPIAGAERIIPLEQALDDLPRSPLGEAIDVELPLRSVSSGTGESITALAKAGMEQVCFYISPIGDEDSEHRKHADLFLGSVIEPALEEFGLKVIRADKIGKPGMITSQILDYILNAKLVVADLSFHNPNVFYELALRHICRLPTVQVIRSKDPIPFDLEQFRTVQIDTSDIYTLVPNLQTYKAEIATQVRAVLSDPDSVDNPISAYYPNLKATY